MCAGPVAVDVQADGRSLAAAAVAWAQRGLLVGSRDGAVAVLHPELLTTQGVGYFCRCLASPAYLAPSLPRPLASTDRELALPFLQFGNQDLTVPGLVTL